MRVVMKLCRCFIDDECISVEKGRRSNRPTRFDVNILACHPVLTEGQEYSLMTNGETDFRTLFEASPEVLLVLLPDAPRFTMVAATESRLAATHVTREQTIGRGLFEVFPDNPDDPAA